LWRLYGKIRGVFKKLFSRAPKKTYPVVLRSLGRTIEVPEGKTVLDAALDAGIPYPHSCCAAECATCLSLLVAGSIREEVDTSHLIGPAQKQAGYFLACQAHPTSDGVVIDTPGVGFKLPDHPLLGTGAKIAALAALNHDILLLELELDRPVSFTAGQYAELEAPGLEAPRNYSFARAATGGPTNRVFFHVRKVPGGAFTSWLHEKAAAGASLRFTGPRGNFALRPGDGPIVCVAGGSGLAPILAMLEEAAAKGVKRPVHLFFGARSQRDLYALDEIERLRAAWQGGFNLHLVLSEEPAESSWAGARGLVTTAIAGLGPELGGATAYLCGPPPMVDAAIAELRRLEMPFERIYFDKFLDRSHRPNIG
jgi:NAD(P)H-flavin reductase/ferredoxin